MPRPAVRLALPLLALAAALPLTLVPASGATTAGDLPAFRSYLAGADQALESGEPTLGVNLKTGAVLYLSGKKTYRVGDWDAQGPGTSTWTDVSALLTSLYTADPILETDTTTGRTFVNQLTYSNPGSVMAYTDDDGETWTNVPYGSGVGPNIDHQSVGFGPWVDGAPFVPVNGYPNAIYYCTNDLAASDCAISLDGGDTFTPARPVYTTDQCAAIHGHLKSAPDGTVYLPPDGCSGGDDGTSPAGVAVSEDNSFTWTVRTVPGSDSGDAGHPSLGIATDGTVYLAYGSKGDGTNYGPVQVARSRDKGKTWTTPVTLGADLGVKSASFPVAAAGDPDRAAVAFLGTTDDGNPRSEEDFTGRWDLYVSTTFDGGATWHTVNATPENPVQVGSICTGGTTCGDDRNLLDFNDMVIDARGHVLIAVADGCTKATCTPANREKHGLIVRQVSGNGLLAAFDGNGPIVVTDPSPSATPSPSPTAPTRAAPVRRPAAPAHPATGLPAALPLAAAAVGAGAVTVVRRRRRA
jgi:hypothetical protein